MHRNKQRQSGKMKRVICLKQKRTRYNLRKKKNLNDAEISNLPDEEFKVIVTKMLTKLRKRMHEYIKNFNKDMENISSKQKSWS